MTGMEAPRVRFAAGTVAVRLVLELNTVERAVPFQRMTLPFTKSLPVAISVIGPDPAATASGEMLESVGL